MNKFSNFKIHRRIRSHSQLENKKNTSATVTFFGITLNGGPAGQAGWMAVFPIEKHEFSTD